MQIRDPIHDQEISSRRRAAAAVLGSSTFAWILCAGYMAVIFYLSRLSSLPIPSLFQWQDFFLHLIEYGVFGYLLSMAFVRSGLRQRIGLYTLLIVVVYGVSDELHQAFVPLRDPSLRDVIADTLGGMLGMLVLHLFGNSDRRNQRTLTQS